MRFINRASIARLLSLLAFVLIGTCCHSKPPKTPHYVPQVRDVFIDSEYDGDSVWQFISALQAWSDVSPIPLFWRVHIDSWHNFPYQIGAKPEKVVEIYSCAFDSDKGSPRGLCSQNAGMTVTWSNGFNQIYICKPAMSEPWMSRMVLMHELGHTFKLPDKKDDESSIMHYSVVGMSKEITIQDLNDYCKANGC